MIIIIIDIKYINIYLVRLLFVKEEFDLQFKTLTRIHIHRHLLLND